MKINLGGITQVSTIDWYGKVAMVIYFRKCNFKCRYCQNYALLEGENFVDIDVVEMEIENARGFIDAVVFSGGEPCLQMPQLERLCKLAKKLGLKAGIETNGSSPNSIEELCDKNLVDAIFLDVKAPLSNAELYSIVTGSSSEVIEKVKKTIEICKKCKVDFEVRTTVFKGLIEHKDEIIEIAKDISGCKRYAIQQGRPELAWSDEIRKTLPLSWIELVELANAAGRYLPEVRIRTKEKGNERIA